MKKIILLAILTIFPIIDATASDFPEFKYRALIDLRIAATDNTLGWLDKGLGKLRYGGDSNDNKQLLAELAQAAIVISTRLSWDITGRLVLKYDPQQWHPVDIIEGFLAYKPITTSSFSSKSRIGIFFPPLSLENKGIAWTSPYTITPSAINSWIGEELRTIGAETTLTKHGEDNRYSLTAAVYNMNDPTGSLLSFRGWAMHDRVLGLNDQVPLAEIDSIQTGNTFDKQSPWVTPFRELDDRWGYYVSLTWKHLDFSELRILHYDNKADPSIIIDGQYAWHTRFINIGIKLEFDNEIEFLSQYMTGNTLMGPFIDAKKTNPIDNDFSSYYLLVSKRIDKHSITLRYDDFKVIDNDKNVEAYSDYNAENGNAWTLAYLNRIKRNQSLIVEIIHISSDRRTRTQIGSPSDISETLLQLSYRLFL